MKGHSVYNSNTCALLGIVKDQDNQNYFIENEFGQIVSVAKDQVTFKDQQAQANHQQSQMRAPISSGDFSSKGNGENSGTFLVFANRFFGVLMLAGSVFCSHFLWPNDLVPDLVKTASKVYSIASLLAGLAAATIHFSLASVLLRRK